MQRAAWWLAGTLVVVVPMLVQRHWLTETYFVTDDFANFATAQIQGLTLDFLTSNFNPWNAPGVHVAPGHHVLDWLVTVPAGNRHGAAILAMVACTGGAVAFTLGTLNDLLGRRVLHYPIVFALGVSFPLLIAASWFAAGAHALPSVCFIAATMWGYSRWKVTGSRWWLAACWLAMALGLAFSPQPVIAVLYVGLLSVLVARELRADLVPLAGLAVIGGAYFVHETIRSDVAARGRTLTALADLLEAMARGALPQVAGLNLPDRLWLLALLGVLGAVALSALGRRGLEGLAFLVVVLVANGVVIWFGRSEVGAAAATEARYLGALTLGFWVAVAIAVAPSPRAPWLPLPDVRGRVRPGVTGGLAAAALVLVCAWTANHYLGRLADGFRGSQFTLQTSAAARGQAYRLDRDLDRLDRSGDLAGLVNSEVPFPFYYDRHPINQIGFLGRAFNDDVEAEGRGPQLFMVDQAAEIKPATFTAVGPPVRRRCEGRCELVLRPRGPAAPTFVRLRLRSGERVTATTTTMARALAKNASPAGTDAAGKTLYRWDLGPVELDAERPDATLQTWALDADEVRVKLAGPGDFEVVGELGTVALNG